MKVWPLGRAVTQAPTAPAQAPHTQQCWPSPSPGGFPGSSAGTESACDAGDLGSIPGLGRSPGEGKGFPLQSSGLENSMDCIVHGGAKSRTRLSAFHSPRARASPSPIIGPQHIFPSPRSPHCLGNFQNFYSSFSSNPDYYFPEPQLKSQLLSQVPRELRSSAFTSKAPFVYLCDYMIT